MELYRKKQTQQTITKNYLINGGMDYDQRIAGATDSVSTPEYFFDRWKNERTGNWSVSPTIEKVAVNITGQAKLVNAMQMSGANATDGTAVSLIEQRIESSFARDLSGKSVSFSFYINESEFQAVDIDFYSADVEDDFSAVTQIGSTVTKTITPDSTWQQIKLENVTMPSDLSKGLLVKITLKMSIIL